jgi:hypothetical protein
VHAIAITLYDCASPLHERVVTGRTVSHKPGHACLGAAGTSAPSPPDSSPARSNSTWQSWATDQIEYARKTTVGYIQKLVNTAAGQDDTAEDDIAAYYANASSRNSSGGGILTWASMSAALPKPIKQLQRSLTAGIAGKGGPDLPMTHQQAHDMTVGAQRARPGQTQDSLHQLGEAL